MPSQGVVSGKSLSFADRSLLCCELQQFLQSLQLVPKQQQVKEIQSSYASSCSTEKFLTLARLLEKMADLEHPKQGDLTACRREGEVLLGSKSPDFAEIESTWAALSNLPG